MTYIQRRRQKRLAAKRRQMMRATAELLIQVRFALFELITGIALLVFVFIGFPILLRILM